MGFVDSNILPLAQFQISFASLLQETEIIPSFLLMYPTAVVLSCFNKICSLVLILQKVFKQKKQPVTQGKLCGVFFLCNSIYVQFLSLDLCFPSLLNLHKKNCKIKSWRFNGSKGTKNVSYLLF